MFSRFGRRKINPPPVESDPGAFIELRGLIKKFHNAAGEFTVLKEIDISFQLGEFASIVGRSGSGKSTLLNMITGIDHPSSGYVRVGDAILHTMDEGRMSVWRGKKMGIVFQFFQLLPMLTLLENVMLPMDFCDMYPPVEREGKAKDLLALVGLGGLEHKYPAAVSGGQQQSAAVARALANDPPILVADEPTGNLDSRTADRVLEIFEEQAEKGKTILMVTHDNGLAHRARRVLVISDGELIPEEISMAFPDMGHDLLLQLAHSAKVCSFQPGEIVQRGENGPALSVIKQGAVWAIIGGTWGTQISADRLQAGCIFSVEDLKALHRLFIGLRAESAVELFAWESLPPSAELRGILQTIAQARAKVFARASKQRGERSLMNGR